MVGREEKRREEKRREEKRSGGEKREERRKMRAEPRRISEIKLRNLLGKMDNLFLCIS